MLDALAGALVHTQVHTCVHTNTHTRESTHTCPHTHTHTQSFTEGLAFCFCSAFLVALRSFAPSAPSCPGKKVQKGQGPVWPPSPLPVQQGRCLGEFRKEAARAGAAGNFGGSGRKWGLAHRRITLVTYHRHLWPQEDVVPTQGHGTS